MLVPIETSTKFAKRLIQYGVERLYFDHRPFPNCRGVELLILRGVIPNGGSAMPPAPQSGSEEKENL
jgi:hypothetical protein